MYTTDEIYEWRSEVPSWLIVYQLDTEEYYRYTCSWGETEEIAAQYADECNFFVDYNYSIKQIYQIEKNESMYH